MTEWNSLGDRRQFPRIRYPCLLTIRKEALEQLDVLLTHTENVGVGGVCVIVKKQLELFSKVDLELDLLDSESHIKCEGRVVWSMQRKVDEKKKPLFFDIGIEFVNFSPEDKQRIQIIVNRLGAQARHLET